MASPALPRLLTWEEFQALPDDDVAIYELDEGRLVAKRMTVPVHTHSRMLRRLFKILDSLEAVEQFGAVYPEFGCLVSLEPPTYLRPDIAVVEHGRDLAAEGSSSFHGAPDLVVEIISPNDRAPRLLRKTQQYLAHGAQAVWLVYQDPAEIHVHTGPEAMEIVNPGDLLKLPAAIADASISVAGIFATAKL